MIFALIPAAGKSARMGQPKLALPWGRRTVLEQVILSLRQASIDHVLVVVGPYVPRLASLAAAAGAHALVLTEETPDMRTTVERGLDWLEAHFHPGDADSWLLVPGDQPTLDAALVHLLLAARAAHPETSIVVPSFQQRRGHPVLIDWKHVPEIRAWPAGQGIDAYLRARAAQTLELPVESASILDHLDTPEDYEALRRAGPSVDE